MKEPADSPMDPFPEFKSASESERLESRFRTKRSPSQNQKESPVPHNQSPGTPASDASQNVKADAKLGDASESISVIPHRMREFIHLSKSDFMSPLRRRRMSTGYIYVFDMRYKIGSIIPPCCYVAMSTLLECEEIKEEAANMLKVPKEQVHIVKKETFTLQRNHLGILIVVDPAHSESHIPILLLVDRNVDMGSENWIYSAYAHDTKDICCVLFPKGEKVYKLKQGLAEKYNLKMNYFALIQNKKKLRETDKIENAVKSYDLLHLKRCMPIDINLKWRQWPNFTQVIDIVGISSLHSVSSLKKLLIKAISESEFQPTLLTVENVCFSREDVLLHDDVLLGFIQDNLQRYHDGRCKASLKLHLVHPVYTWFKIDTETMTRTRVIEVICVNPKSSTAQLRAEVAKICICPSQAVKLVASGKKIPEKERIEEIPFLQEGCTIRASISSQIQVNITVTMFSGQRKERLQQLQVKVYKLDSVLKLKQIVVKRLKSPVEMYICDLKKECVLEETKFLKDYGIVNATEIMACIFENRIQINVVVLKTKKKMQVFIDEPKSTTVQNFLVYAKTQGLIDVHYSELRLLYKDRCLPLESSLCDADVQHDTMLVITTIAKMSPGKIIMLPEKTGEALCVTGIVIRGRIYYASGPADEADDLESYNEPAVPPGVMHLLKSSSIICKHNNPSPVPSLVLPSPLIIENINMEISERKEDSYCNEKSEGASQGGYYQQEEQNLALSQLEDKKIQTGNSSNLQQEVKQVCGNMSEGYSTESSNVGIIPKSYKSRRLKYLKRARNLQAKSESSADDAVGPQSSQILNSDKSEVELDDVSSAGQSNVTFKSVMTCGPLNSSSTQSWIGTEVTAVTTTTCVASCSTITQSNIGPAALNYVNTGQINTQSTERNVYRGGYSVKFYQNGSDIWRCSSTEEIVQVGNASAGPDTSAVISSRVKDMEFSLDGHRSTHMLTHSSSEVLAGSLLEHQGFTAELLHSIAEAVGVNWRKLARKLSISEEKIENIDTNSRFSSCDEKCYQMLFCWCKSSKHATQQILASKLIACELRLIAVKFLGDYMQDNHNTV